MVKFSFISFDDQFVVMMEPGTFTDDRQRLFTLYDEYRARLFVNLYQQHPLKATLELQYDDSDMSLNFGEPVVPMLSIG